MVFVYGDDTPRKRFPWCHYSLIGIWVIFYGLTHLALGHDIPGLPTASFKEQLELWAILPYDLEALQTWKLCTTLLLFPSLLSLILHILLLWLVGDNVESEVGRIPYLLLFFFFGILGIFAHFFTVYGTVLSSSYLVGPSASISGILGMYLALYPKARLKAYALGIGAFYLKMRWALLYWLSLPFLLNALEGNSLPQNPYGTALAVPPHFAIHAGFLLLGAVLALLFRKKWPLPSNASSPLQINSSEARHSSKEEDFIQEIEAVQKKSQEITQWLYQDPKKGRDAYLKFSQEYPYFVLEPDSQLECAYSLYETGEEASAREALEQYLSHYPQGPYLGDVHLLLGKIYSQIPFLLEEAQTHLESALSRLEEGSARQEAQKTLRKIHKILNKIRETALKNDEPCVILCQNMKVKKIERIAQIIEFFNHTPLAHTLNFLQRTKGVIATNIPSDKALLAEKVIQDETKTPVLVVSESLLGKLPERYAIEEIEISKEALRFIGKSQVFYRSFADIQLVGVTQLHEAKGPQVTQQDSLVFDFFVFNPRLHFQMIDGVFRHSKNPQETGKLITPKKYATLFKRYGKSIPNNLGLSILADRGDWSEVTFLSKEDHEWYYRWLLYLLSPPSKKPPTKTLPLPIPGVLV